MAREVKFGVFLPTSDFAQARAAAERAEALGFYSVSLNDHFFAPMAPAETPQLECFTTLSAIAALTRRVKIAPAMAAMSFRNPALLAKMTSTLDVISGGRFILGIGAGWMRDEYHAHDYPYPTNRQRLDQLAEGIKLIRTMWTAETPTYHGPFFKVEKAFNFPRPLQKPHPPIMVGGSGSRLLQITAREADIANLIAPITRDRISLQSMVRFDKARLKSKIAQLRDLAEAAGRPPDAIEISTFGSLTLSPHKSVIDDALAVTAKMMGFPDTATVRNSPAMLFGTPDEVKRELRSRIEELGITYFILSGSLEAFELFASQVMPEFV
ncbi:MAG TPA: LLM class flavin-dependent oxidoreductase [Candidatus Binataceae bacterium]|nr:LLM class flavin-dependent oxidoreductase [Candidatus Binataceae bacterium]